VRWPSLAIDFWELDSAERRHAESPDTFWIPDRAERERLQPGQAAKLLFVIEADENGVPVLNTERMWVFVTEVLAEGYIGILDNQPGSIEPDDGGHLILGAEVPFRAEHVIDVATPPEDYVVWQRSQPPLRLWPRA
jgi:hypothetical protein